MVIHKETEQIFKTNFINGMVQLVPVSNHTAMEKIEQGLSEFAKELKKTIALKVVYLVGLFLATHFRFIASFISIQG